jgi:hypothetical protein
VAKPRRPVILFALLFIACAPVTPWLRPASLEAQVWSERSAGEIADSLAIAALTQSLVRDAPSDSARAAAIYEWVARNVAYDLPGYLDGRIGGETPESVFGRRVAVCSGFVALYERMAREAGLVVVPINGYAKGFDYRHGQSTRRMNHAWLAVRLAERWHLVDPTWGAGAVRAGRFEPAFDWYYFMASPEELILSHFPENIEWQLVAQPMRRRDFERLPAVPRALFHVGFTPAAVRSSALASGARDFPAVGAEAGVRVVRAPVAGTLPRDATVDVEVIWPGAADVALVSGSTWTHLSRAGDRFHGQAAPAATTLWLVGRTEPDPLSYRTLLHYRVE